MIAEAMKIGGPLRFGLREAQAAAEAWRFNCGPGALCAVLGMTPEEIRPHLLDFESRGYTNPTLMANILHRLEVPFKRVFECREKVEDSRTTYPSFGLVRIQIGGPWMRPQVPIKARYWHTHWVAVRGHNVFDINAICEGGWLSFAEWSSGLMPWLIREGTPRSDGTFFPTHCWEIERKVEA